MDDLRQTGLLKNLGAMDAYCWQHGGSITEDRRSYGYIAETENYRFCLRCTPFPGEYQGYLYCYDLCQQEMYRQEHPVVGRVTFASGEQQEFTDSKALLQAIREELPFRSTTGFRFETLTDDPEVKKAVDDILLDFAGEDNSRRTCNYGLTETGKQALRKAADPSIPHTYAWFVMADTNTPQEIIRQDLTLEEAIQIYQDSNTSEKRLGVINDGQRSFQFCCHILFEAACCELDIPKWGQHQTNSQHRHKESVSSGNGNAGSQCKAEQRCEAHHGEPVCPSGGCQDRLRLGDLTPEVPCLFSFGRLVDIGTDTAGSCGQTGKEIVAQFPRRDMQHHKKPCNHADAGNQLDHSHSSSSFP